MQAGTADANTAAAATEEVAEDVAAAEFTAVTRKDAAVAATYVSSATLAGDFCNCGGGPVLVSAVVASD